MSATKTNLNKIVTKLLLSCLLAGCIINGGAQTIVQVAVKAGYRALWFGMPVEVFQHKVKTEKLYSDGHGLLVCRIVDPVYLRMGNCALAEGWARFYDGKLLQLEVHGNDNYDCLLDAYRHLFADSALHKKTDLAINKQISVVLWPDPNMGYTTVLMTGKKMDADYGRYCRKRKVAKYGAEK